LENIAAARRAQLVKLRVKRLPVVSDASMAEARLEFLFGHIVRAVATPRNAKV
jgi:hypothetical protein